MPSSVIYVIVDGTRAHRLLSMLWLLRTYGSLSTKELANRLEASRRAVLRDAEALSAAGITVYCERGARGGVRLLSGYRTDVTASNNDESRALFASLSSWGPNALGLSDAYASGVRKLLAAVPEKLRSESVTMVSRVFIDPKGWRPRLQALVSAGSDWYLCASEKGTVRFFKVVRTEGATLMLISCCGPEIDLARTWQAHRAKFLGQFNAMVVAGSIRGERWEDAREWSICATEKEPTDGGCQIVCVSGFLPERLFVYEHDV